MCVRNERTAMYERNQGRSGCVSSPRHRRCPAPDARRACAFYFPAKARFEFVVTFPIHPFNISPPPFVALHVSYTNECFVFNSVACFLFAVLHPQLLRPRSFSLRLYPFPLRTRLRKLCPAPFFYRRALRRSALRALRARLATHWWRSNPGLEQKHGLRNQNCIADYQ